MMNDQTLEDDTIATEYNRPPVKDPLPRLLSEAAMIFPNMSDAYAQLRPNGRNYPKLRIQALEIMMEFVGDVQFGRDPRGLLFYDSLTEVNVAKYTISYHRGPGSFKTVCIDFYPRDGGHGQASSARFLTRLDTKKYPLPPVGPGQGEGQWKPFKAATSNTMALRIESSTRLYLQLPPLKKRLYFSTCRNTSINTRGLLIFRDLERLQNGPVPCVVKYTPDTMTFHLKGNGRNVVALFIPAEPMTDIGDEPTPLPEATWEHFEPDE